MAAFCPILRMFSRVFAICRGWERGIKGQGVSCSQRKLRGVVSRVSEAGRGAPCAGKSGGALRPRSALVVQDFIKQKLEAGGACVAELHIG